MDTSIKLFWFSAFFLAQSLFVYTIAHSDEGGEAAVPAEVTVTQSIPFSIDLTIALTIALQELREAPSCRDMNPCDK